MIKNICIIAGVVAAHHHHHHREAPISLISLQSDPICGSGWCEKTLPKDPKGHPVDYFVPNFGVDHDIKTNENSLAIAEKERGHKLYIEDCSDTKGKPCNPALWTKYNYAPEISDEVTDTQNSISLAEDQVGHEFTAQDVRFVDDKYTYAS